jgi:TonB family protein
VLIECIVDTNGRVQEARITQSLSRQNDATALQTVKQWKFLPTERDGKPVAVRTTIGVVF